MKTVFCAVAAMRVVPSLGRAASFEATSFDNARPSGPVSASQAMFRRYRVQASVTLFGVPVIGKNGVGAAGRLVEEAVSGSHCSSVVQFLGGSWPDRTKGFNRFGMTQEIVREEDGAIVQSGYLSFMTSSPEKNSDQASEAFADRPRNLALVLACGLASSTGYRWVLQQQPIPAEAIWMDCPALMERFRHRDISLDDSKIPTNRNRVYPREEP